MIAKYVSRDDRSFLLRSNSIFLASIFNLILPLTVNLDIISFLFSLLILNTFPSDSIDKL